MSFYIPGAFPSLYAISRQRNIPENICPPYLRLRSVQQQVFSTSSNNDQLNYGFQLVEFRKIHPFRENLATIQYSSTPYVLRLQPVFHFTCIVTYQRILLFQIHSSNRLTTKEKEIRYVSVRAVKVKIRPIKPDSTYRFFYSIVRHKRRTLVSSRAAKHVSHRRVKTPREWAKASITAEASEGVV